MINKETIEYVIPQLMSRGENAKELNFWQRIFRDLPPQLQDELTKNLETELRLISENI